MEYRRSKTKGGTYFFTLVTYKRKKLFQNIYLANLFLNIIKQIKFKYPFKMSGFVLLPDHFHCIWTLPENDMDFSIRWRLIKSNFTRQCLSTYKTKPTSSRSAKKEQCIWQRRFWEHEIKNEIEFSKYLDYIHFNPVKHGYVNLPCEWQHSSFHYYVKKEIYPINWGADNVAMLNKFVANE